MDIPTAIAFVALALLQVCGLAIVFALVQQQKKKYILPMYDTIGELSRTESANTWLLATLQQTQIFRPHTDETATQVTPRGV